ncbi:MAG: hypothetical protein NC900_04340 [Candidatus Omnitrophica bacterium]|nr:hypothetical protein [Candidatus Omnitrophota bacterium]
MNNFIDKNLNFIRLSLNGFLFTGMDFCLRKRLKLAKKYLLKGDYKTLDDYYGGKISNIEVRKVNRTKIIKFIIKILCVYF